MTPSEHYNKEDLKPDEEYDLDLCETPEDLIATLSYRDGKMMLEALQRPAKPNQKLMNALAKHKELTDEHL